MTDKKDDTNKGTPGSSQGKPVEAKVSDIKTPDPKVSELKGADPKRPHATIDLKATEIASKTVKPDPVKSADAAKVDTKGATPTATPSATSAAKTDGAPPKSPTKPTETPDNKASKAAPTPPVVRPARSGGGLGSMLSHLVMGLVGGAAAWWGLNTYGSQINAQLTQMGVPIPAGDTKAAEALAKVAVLEKLIDAKATSTSGDLAGKLAAAQAQIAKLEASAKSVADLSAAQTKLAADTKAVADKVAELAGSEGPAARLGTVEEKLKLMSQVTGDPAAGKGPQIAALAGRVVDLESTLAAQVSALRNTVTQQVEQRLATTNETSEAAKSGTTRMDRELSAVKSELAATAQKYTTVRSDTDRLATAVTGLRDDTNGVKTAVDALKSDIEAKYKATAKPGDVSAAIAPMAGKLTSLEASVQSVVKAEDERKTNSERILLSLELNNLKRVLDRGQPFAAELADVTKAAAGKVDLSVLEAYKNGTVATLAELSREFRDAANAIIDAETDSGDGTVMGRMLEGAKSVIRVRRVDLKADDKSAEAIVGRMDKALRDGRIGDVLAEGEKLPPKSQKAAAGWLDKVKARAAVDRAIATLEGALKSSLGGAPVAAAPVPTAPTPPAAVTAPPKPPAK